MRRSSNSMIPFAPVIAGLAVVVGAASLLVSGGGLVASVRVPGWPGAPGAGASAPTGAPGIGRRAPRGLASLPDTIAAGVVERAVGEALDGAGRAEVLVAFDSSEVQRVAEERAGGGADRRDRLIRGLAEGHRLVMGRALDGVAGAVVLERFEHTGVASVRFTSVAALLRVANDGFVRSIALPRELSATTSESLGVIRQPTVAAAGARGAGVGVAIIDSGLEYTNNPAFGSCGQLPSGAGCRVVVAEDVAPDDGMQDDPSRAIGRHGTNVGGIVAAVAPGASLLSYDVFAGTGTNSTIVHRAIDRVLAVAARYNVRAINLSIGAAETYWRTECTASGYATAFANARAAGILPVVSAGNDFYVLGSASLGISDPACAPGAVRVGATYDAAVEAQGYYEVDQYDNIVGTHCIDGYPVQDRVACFSQTADLLTLYAPGALITAGGLLDYRGTSMAAPHVAGAVAVLAGARPTASLTAIVNALATTGPLVTDPRPSGPDTKRRLDLAAALAALPAPTVDTTPPVFTSASPTSSIPVAWRLGPGAETPLTLTWRATDASGIDRYVVQWWVGGAWTDLTPYLTSPTAEQLTITDLYPGQSYWFSVIARDRAGNWSQWRTSTEIRVALTQENGSGVAYYGSGWKRAASTYGLGGYIQLGNGTNAYARYTFTGRQVAWVGFRAPDRGVARVYLDGVLVATVDLYQSTYEPRRIHVVRSVDPTVRHTLDVQVAGTRTPAWIDLDAFLVLK